MAENTMTREEKIDTMKIFAGFTEKERRLIALGSALGEHKAKCEAQEAEEKKGA